MQEAFVHRPLVMSDGGLVVSGHHKASEAGAEMLRRGGNAMDAAIATAATLAVAVPHMNGLGGDAIALYYDAGANAVTAINGSGAGPMAATVEHYQSLGYDSIPQRGPLSMSVPGAIAAWGACIQRWGSRSLAECLEFAIDLAEAGTPVDVSQRDFLTGPIYAAMAKSFPGLTEVFGAADKPRRLGERIRQPALARTLQRLAAEGALCAYEGAVAKDLLADLAQAGALLSDRDLAAHETGFAESLHVSYRGRRVHAAPPNSQGLALLFLLALTEHDSSVDDLNAREFDASVYMRMKKAAFAMRDRYCVDPSRIQLPEDLFSPVNVSRLIHDTFPTDSEARAGGGDTSTLVVVDVHGNAVSWVQSLFEAFGSGVISPQTGVILHNRLYLERLSSDPLHGLIPGLRPFHTLCPALVTKEGRCEMVIATPGDHGQPQSIYQVLRGVYERSLTIQQAIEQPRLRHDEGREVMLEDRAPPSWARALKEDGYAVSNVGPWARVMGGVNAIQRLDDEVWAAGADPRRSSYAVSAGPVRKART